MKPSPLTAPLFSLLLGLSVWQGGALAATTATAVGEVTFTIGNARRIESDGQATSIVRGMPIRVSDRIETSDGGHVHVRFVDGAFVSVRPASRLLVELYHYDASQPAASSIRFRLEEGVARSVTGKGGQAARDRFRLNTPIAAIGVKGTDFIVTAAQDSVRVAVQSGAVVVAPFGGGCQLDALGPCATDTARVLSADMGAVMLEIQRQHTVPRFVPVIGDNATARNDRVAPTPGNTTRPAEVVEEPRAADVVAKPPAPPVVVEPPPVVVVPPPAVVEPPPVVTPPAPEPPPVVVLPPPPPPALLSWGRWSWAKAVPGDTISQSFAEASLDKKVTIASNTYGLFRPETSSPVKLPTDLGQISFTLRDAQAQFTPASGAASVATVGQGALTIDFGNRRVSTVLQLSHPTVGDTLLGASTGLRNDGVFNFTDSAGKVSGATTEDGKEAAYLFERYLPAGTISGITRWYK